MSRPSRPESFETGDPEGADKVGPVLTRGPRTDAVVAAILALNASVEVIDRQAYLRVLAPGSCRVTRQAVEAHLNQDFKLPEDLEELMPSFKGQLVVTEHEVIWRVWEKIG